MNFKSFIRACMEAKREIDDGPTNEVILVYLMFFGFIFYLCSPLLNVAVRHLALLNADLELQIKKEKASRRANVVPGNFPDDNDEQSPSPPQKGAVHSHSVAPTITHGMQNTEDSRRLARVMATNKELQARMNEMQKEQQQSQRRISEMQKEEQRLQESRKSIAEAAAVSNAQLKAIEDDLDETKKNLATYQRKVHNTQHQRKIAKRQLNSTRRASPAKIRATTQKLVLAQRQLFDTKEKYEAAQQANNDVSAELAELKQQQGRTHAQAHSTMNKEDETENESLRDQLTAVKQQLENEHKEHAALSDKHNNLIIEGNEELQKLRDLIVHHSERAQQLEQQTAGVNLEYESRIQQLEQEKVQTERDHKEKVDHVYRQANEHIATLDSENKRLKESTRQPQSGTQNENLQVDAVRQELENLRSEYSALTAHHNNVQKDLQEFEKLKSDHASLNIYHEKAQQELQQRDRLVNDLRAQSDRLERDNENKDVVIANLEAEKEELTRLQEASKLHGGEVCALYDQHNRAKKSMQADIDMLRNGNLHAAKKLQEMTDDRDAQAYHLVQEQRRAEDLEKTVQDLRDNQVGGLQRQVQMLSAELSTLKQQDKMEATPAHDLHQQIEKLKTELRQEQITRVRAQGQFDSATKKIADLEKKVPPTSGGITGGIRGLGSRNEVKWLKEDLEARDKQIKELKAELAEKNQKTETKETPAADSNDALTALTSLVDSLRIKNTQQQVEVQQKADEIQQSDARARNLGLDFETARKAYEKQIADLKEELEKAKAQTSTEMTLDSQPTSTQPSVGEKRKAESSDNDDDEDYPDMFAEWRAKRGKRDKHS